MIEYFNEVTISSTTYVPAVAATTPNSSTTTINPTTGVDEVKALGTLSLKFWGRITALAANSVDIAIQGRSAASVSSILKAGDYLTCAGDDLNNIMLKVASASASIQIHGRVST